MANENQFGGSNQSLNCADFDARLAELLDGTMAGAELEAFRAHAESCMDCGPLFSLADQGMRYLKMLPQVEPPSNLVHNILAATTMKEVSAAPVLAGTTPSWLRRLSDKISPNLLPSMSGLMQPRLAMTAAMAFFSISMLMNVAGIKVSDFRNMDLRPSAISTSASLQYHATTAKVVKYYENIRFVYEFQTRVEELKKAATSGTETTPAPADDQKKKKANPQDDNSSQNPPQQQNEKYSLEKNGTELAMLKDSELMGPVATRIEQDWRTS